MVDINLLSSEMADCNMEDESIHHLENLSLENSNVNCIEMQTQEYNSTVEDIRRNPTKQVDYEEPGTVIDCEQNNTPSTYSSSCHLKDIGRASIAECPINDSSTTSSSFDVRNELCCSSSSSTENPQKVVSQNEDIVQYENEVLSDPFYESDCGSDTNETLDFIDKNINKQTDKLESKKHEPNIDLLSGSPYAEKHKSTDVTSAPNSSTASNHYFIDASSLNDEVDIIGTNIKNDSCLESHISASADFSHNVSNVVSEPLYRFTPLRTANFQTGHNRVAEFEPEIKLTEYFEPLNDTNKIKRVNSTSLSKDDADKSTNKESLVVEIKETDSGESTHPSPCPDNNTNTSKESIKNLSENVQQPVLIRRNTFELDSNDEKLSILRQEHERRQGNLVFQSSIPQYSGHRVDGDVAFDMTTDPVNNTVNNYSSSIQTPPNKQYHMTSYLSLDNEHSVDKQSSESNYLLERDIDISNVLYSSKVENIVESQYYPELKDNLDIRDECSNSLPATVNYTLENNRIDSIKRTKRDEATPIISGGVSTSDYSKPIDSPTVRRKTESTPIVSGGSTIMNDSTKSKSLKMSTSMTAWVVDMSDCTKSDSGSSIKENTLTGMSQSFSTSECVKNSVQSNSHEKHSSLGFFVNLNSFNSNKEIDKKESTEEKKETKQKDGKPYCEFYIDMSGKSENVNSSNKEIEKEGNDKKNIFSMFIDLNDPHKITKNTPKTSHKRSLSSFNEKRVEAKINESTNSENSSIVQQDEDHNQTRSEKEKTKKSVFMFIESDSPVVRRRTLSSSRSGFKRHSWNVDKTQNSNNNGHVTKESVITKEHKRAHSLSVDQKDLRNIQTKPSSSSHSLSDAAATESVNRKDFNSLQEVESNSNNMDTSTEDALLYDTKDTPPNSHIEIINEELRVSVKNHEINSEGTGNLEDDGAKVYEDEYSDTSPWGKTCTESTNGQTRKSETFDISSGSGPSPSSDNPDYELTDLLNQDVETTENKHQTGSTMGSKILETHKSLNETIKKIECELKSPEYEKLNKSYSGHTSIVSKSEELLKNQDVKDLQGDKKKSCSKFVRLSDLDKTAGHSQPSDFLIAKESRASCRMSNSIPETSWIESKLVVSRTNDSVRTLSRKFPSVMSTSLPSKQKSPLEELTGDCEAEGIISESDISSMQSSMGRSGAEGSTEETETSSLAGGKPYNRLGEDLLRMFLEEINPDVTIDVAGRHIRAHKCILSSRCQYFAAILSGGWIESAGNVISLLGYSYNAVHFALRHIYSGESNIPDTISIVELATLADMLCLEGLKEVIGYTLKVKYCHLFHKPCQICAVGVLECLPLAAAYGLDEVYRKSLRWITRYFVRIWPCKAFATLPRELMEKCYLQHVVHMSTDNVLQTMMDCEKLLAILPNVRWAEPVFRMTSNLLETSLKFLSDNFSGVLSNDSFQSLGRDLTWNISHLEDNFLTAAERLPAEQACKSYSKLHKILSSTQTEGLQSGKTKWSLLFVDFLKKIQTRVEKCLVREAARAARSTTWLKMDVELRRRIQELACLVILPHESTKCQSRHSNFLKVQKTTTSTTNRNLDLKRVKMAISEHNDKTMKQMSNNQQPRKVLNKPKSDPVERKLQEDKPNSNDTSSRPKSWPNKIEVKSRYLEPRNKFVPKENTQQTMPQEKISIQRRKIAISSSDSSRTSSPATKRVTEKKPTARVKLPVKKDIKALSSDSLTESNVNRPNKKKSIVSKSCGITRPESPSFKQKNTEIGLSVDSLAESKNKPVISSKKINKMDTSMSTDSLMTEMSTTTPKSNALPKLSPTLNKGPVMKPQIYDRVKKSSSPMQQRSPIAATRRPPRSLENSTAASRSRAAAIHTCLNLRKNLLDAAKAPDIPSKSLNSVASRSASRQVTQSISSPVSAIKKERKDGSGTQQSSDNSSKRSSPKSSTNRSSFNKSTTINKRPLPSSKNNEDKVKIKCHNEETPKQLTVGSRSGTFLKDEPTILKKVDIKSSQIST